MWRYKSTRHIGLAQTRSHEQSRGRSMAYRLEESWCLVTIGDGDSRLIVEYPPRCLKTGDDCYGPPLDFMQVHEAIREVLDDGSGFPVLFLVCLAAKPTAAVIGFTDDCIDLVDRDQRRSDQAQQPRNATNNFDRGLLEGRESEASDLCWIQVHALQPSVGYACAFQVL